MAEVEMLLDLARETERQGTDAKAEALLELIYKLQQEENAPQLKLALLERLAAGAYAQMDAAVRSIAVRGADY